MKKTFVGSAKLKNNFKMFRVKYESLDDMERIKSEIMDIVNDYLNQNGGYLFVYFRILVNVK